MCNASNREKGEVVLIGDATAAWAKGFGEEFLAAETLHKAHIQSLQNG